MVTSGLLRKIFLCWYSHTFHASFSFSLYSQLCPPVQLCNCRLNTMAIIAQILSFTITLLISTKHTYITYTRSPLLIHNLWQHHRSNAEPDPRYSLFGIQPLIDLQCVKTFEISQCRNSLSPLSPSCHLSFFFSLFPPPALTLCVLFLSLHCFSRSDPSLFKIIAPVMHD